MPFGAVRDDVGTITQTDFGYTSQRNLPETGLMDYKARFYSPYITQFSQPDSIIPDQYNPQALNRYAYALNNPLRYSDPSGHKACEDEYGDCLKRPSITKKPTQPSKNKREKSIDDIVWYSQDGGWNYPEYSTWNLLRQGSACTACHVTHWTGRIPTNNQISLTQVQGWRSLDKYTIPVHLAGLGQILFYASEASKGTQLYRGLSSDHPQLQTYRDTGNVVPRGGSATVYEHVMGNTRSNYTSWTKSIEVAEGFAGPDGTILTINTVDLPNTTIPTYTWSPFDELEILIEGIVEGAKSVIP